MNWHYIIVFCFVVFGLSNCSSEKYKNIAEIEIVLNPSNRAPLAALAKITGDESLSVGIRVIGKNGADSDVKFDFKQQGKKLNIPILGLYPDHNNKVEFVFKNKNGQLIGKQLEEIITVPYEGTQMKILSKESHDLYESGFISVSTVDAKNGFSFWDEYGECRAVYNIPAFYTIRLQNGNYLYTKGTKLFEIDIIGAVVNTIKLPDPYMRVHHDFYEMPDAKTLLLLVDKKESQIITSKDTFNTIEDHLIALDRETGKLLKEWDFREILDVDRYTLNVGNEDWLHSNAVYYEHRDSSIIISAGKQGIFKVGYNDGHFRWLLSPHSNFKNAGWDGSIEWNPDDYLLTAVDKSGKPYSEAIQKGIAYPKPDEDSFHWSFSQHNPLVVGVQDSQLHLLVFNNNSGIILDDENVINAINPGEDDRSNNQVEYLRHNTVYNFAKTIYRYITSESHLRDNYTLMIEYAINEKERTVKQYSAFNQDKFSPACSGVDIGEETGNFMMFGTGFCTGEGRFTEFTRDGKIVYDCNFIIDAYRGLYRADKYKSLYPAKGLYY